MEGQRPSGKPYDISKREVWRAWEKVKENRGSPGADAVSIAEFEDGLLGNLYKIWNRMSSGSYFPPPVKGVEIPKTGGGGTRLLGVPTIADRVAQTVAAARIEAVAEGFFHPDSYGYRPGKGAHDAIVVAQQRCWEHDWVIDLDVRKFFDSVRWDLVIRAVEDLGLPPWVLLYVKRWLAAPVMMPDGQLSQRDKGTPQGSAVSPVLANLFLHWAFDHWMAREFPDCPFERYADDAVIHCESEARARQVLAALEQRMREVGLELHPEKTRIVYCKDDNRRGSWDGPASFDFLGFTFRARSRKGKRGRFTGFGPAVSDKALARMGETVRNWRLGRAVSLTWKELAQWVSPVIRGWMGYYGRFYRSALYPLLGRINYHVQKWVRAKYKRLRPLRTLARAWKRITTQYPRHLPHWEWVTWAWR